MREESGWVGDDSTLGARLAMVRHRMGWNVKEAALACGLPVQSWRGWEKGMRPRDYVDVCTRVSATSGAALDWLLTGSGVSPGGGPGVDATER